MHGVSGPMHASLLHREAQAKNRATILSINSMVGFAAFFVGAQFCSEIFKICNARYHRTLKISLFLMQNIQECAIRLPTCIYYTLLN
jgi:hypothetical protein